MDGFNELRIVKIFCVLCLFCCAIFSVRAQSTNQNFPTAITTNEISGRIPARDVGDARLTSHFYVFNATQGDVFINVVTGNLNGDIDVFTADNLRPLTKITIYADTEMGETGRVVYLRQPSKLILRIEGRTPNDTAATYRIKFAGSFAPAQAATAENADSETPTVKSDNQTDVRVNSVGTIIEIKPKPTPEPKETVAEIAPEKESAAPPETAENKSNSRQSRRRAAAAAAAAAKKQAIIVEEKKEAATPEETPTSEKAEPPAAVTNETTNEKANQAKTDAPIEVVESPAETESKEIVSETTETEPKPAAKKIAKPKPPRPLPAAALENIRLIVSFKDGTKIERPMSEILKVGVDKGVLTVVSRDGQIKRYSILDVEKMTIE